MHLTGRSSTIKTLLIGVLIILGTMSAASAQDAPVPDATPEDRVSRSFAFYPAETGFGTFFAPEIAAGETATVTVLIGNTGDVDQSIRTYASNAFTNEGGGFAAAEYGVAPEGVTTWLDYPETIFDLVVQEGIELPFEISVPEGTEPGQYITAISAEHADPLDIEGVANVTQKLRFTIPVFITVPGETTSGFDTGDIDVTTVDEVVVISVELQNTGDVRVRPEGTISLVDAEGDLAVSIPVQMESIYAHDATTLSVATTEPIPVGDYTVRVALADAETGESIDVTSEPATIDLAATPEPTLITITSASVEPGPTEDNVQFTVVDATIANTGEPVTNAQLSLLVSKDGDEVERFPISQALSLQQGDTAINTRYIPLEGWSSGEWTFELLLETVDPSGTAVVVASQLIEDSIAIP